MYEFYEKLLQQRGVTSADVCSATGIGQATIAAWKKRKGVLGAEYLLKIAKYFNVQMEYFLGGEFIEYNSEKKEFEKSEEEYYIDSEAKEMAQFLFKNPEYRTLFDASRKVKPEDLKKALQAIGLFID